MFILSAAALIALFNRAICAPSTSGDWTSAAGASLAKRDAPKSSIPLENNPWYLSDIVIIEASTNTTPQIIQSSISFDIRDTNPQLEFNSSCSYTAPNGTTGPPVTPSPGYTQCENPDVGFEYQWQKYGDEWIGTIGIIRGYAYNDTNNNGQLVEVSVFGWWNVTPHLQPVSGGVQKTQSCLEIYVTAEVE